MKKAILRCAALLWGILMPACAGPAGEEAPTMAKETPAMAE